MARETINFVFRKDGEELKHTWVIKKGIRGGRDAKKVYNLIKKWGSPVEIIGDGYVAKMMRKEYALYVQDQKNYPGISTKDILVMGSEMTGISPKKLKAFAGNLTKKIEKKIRG